MAPAEKERARELTVRVLRETDRNCARFVRVNGADTALFQDDLRAVAELDLDGIVLPKASPEAVRALGPGGPPVLCICETAIGVRLAYEIGCEQRVFALGLGAADLGAELGLEPRADGQEVLYARSKLVVDSAAAGIRAPFDIVHLDVRDDAGLEAEARLARSLGLRGKLCIHPAQVDVINRVFSPTAEEVAWAERVLATFDAGVAEGRGAVGMDGTMVDLPVVERARTVLAEAKGAGAT